MVGGSGDDGGDDGDDGGGDDDDNDGGGGDHELQGPCPLYLHTPVLSILQTLKYVLNE